MGDGDTPDPDTGYKPALLKLCKLCMHKYQKQVTTRREGRRQDDAGRVFWINRKLFIARCVVFRVYYDKGLMRLLDFILFYLFIMDKI